MKLDHATPDADLTTAAENEDTTVSADQSVAQTIAAARPIPRTKRSKATTARAESDAAPRTDSDAPAESDAGPRDDAGSAPGATTSSASRQISITVSARGAARMLAALVVVAALVGVGFLGWGYYQGQQRLAAFDDAKNASAIFAQKLTGSMNATDITKLRDVVGPLSTGAYRKHLDEQMGDTVKAIQSLQVKTTKTEVKQVSVVEFDATHAQTTVTVEVTGTSTMAPQGGTSLFIYSLTLDKKDALWLVSDVEALQGGVSSSGQGNQTQGTPPQGTTTQGAPGPTG